MNTILSPATTQLFDACLKMTGGDRAAAAMLALVETMSSQKPVPKAAAPDELTVAEAAERLRCSEMTSTAFAARENWPTAASAWDAG